MSRITSRIGLAIVATAILIDGCGAHDALTIPSQRAHADLLDLSGMTSSIKADTQSTLLVFDPAQGGQYSLGNGNKLYIQPGGICDLGSEYGPAAWDLPCKLADLPVVIVARTWYDASQHPHVEFSPALRFVPRDDGSSAELWLNDKAAADDDASVIRYCDELKCYDESAGDRSLATLHDKSQGFVFRRIKHFSGYQVSTGRDGEPADSTGGGGQ
jgi:hypothetical protein